MNSTIYHDDYINIIDIIPDNSIDLIVTDPPYGLTANVWDKQINIKTMWRLFKNILKINGGICLTSSEPFTAKLIMSNIDMFKHEWVWKKEAGSNFANTVREPMKEHELVLFFSEGKWTYNPIQQQRIGSRQGKITKSLHNHPKSTNYHNFGKKTNTQVPNLRVPSSVQFFKRDRGLHPTQKPLKLIEYLIKTYSNKNDIILDPFAGSGTTALACIHTDRKYICIEKDKTYFNIMQQRIKEPITMQKNNLEKWV